tara:strand:+ start:161 stop:838 length:678 start_codon:yes stop_codon:yes gene_type:complete
LLGYDTIISTLVEVHEMVLIVNRIILGLVFCGILVSNGAEKEIALFDGKTFQGWEGNLKIFRIEKKAIVGGTLNEKIAHNEFLCTKKIYKNFILRLEVKLLGGAKANAGIQIRTKRIPNHHEVIGYQADMGKGWWGSLYDESRRRRVLSKADPTVIQKILKPNNWNRYEIRCEGNRIRLYINGTQTIDYTEADPKIPLEGVIALQIHGGPPSEAWYRNIRLTPLP